MTFMSSDEKIRVLIAEDQELARTGLMLRLRDVDDVEVVGAVANGADAVNQAHTVRPDVILMDIGLPVMDGIAATQAVKSQLPDVRVVMLTSHDTDTEVFASLSAGADGYALKDTTLKQLVLAIKTVSEGSVWLHPEIAKRVLLTYKASWARVSGSADEKRQKFELSDREADVLKLVVDGLGNQEIADRLFVSLETVKTHMTHILQKLSVSDRTQAAVKALKEGIVHL
jgi:DNA-binding NarL/FixJ family response regulator